MSSMYLDPLGDVRACCQNRWHRYGNIAQSSLRELWNSVAADELRSRLDAGDLSLGCELCAAQIENAGLESAYLNTFESLRSTKIRGLAAKDPSAREARRRPEWPRQLELALSIACNLQCVMCNGDLSSAIRVHREHRAALAPVYNDEFFVQLGEFLPHLERIILLGGEPFLGSEPQRVIDMLIGSASTADVHVTTNGMVWNRLVERSIEQLRMHIAVSVDGASAATVERIREGAVHGVILKNLQHFVDALGSERVSLTYCLMPQNALEFADFLRFAESCGLRVFVNSVTHPPEFSLAHCSAELLERLATRMNSDAPSDTELVLNRKVWLQAVHEIHALVDARAGTRVVIEGPSARVRAGRGSEGGNVVAIGISADLLIEHIDGDAHDPGTGFPVNLDGLKGQPATSVLPRLSAVFGELLESRLMFAADGVEERIFRFGLPTGRGVLVTAAMEQRSGGGETWYVGLRATGSAG